MRLEPLYVQLQRVKALVGLAGLPYDLCHRLSQALKESGGHQLDVCKGHSIGLYPEQVGPVLLGAAHDGGRELVLVIWCIVRLDHAWLQRRDAWAKVWAVFRPFSVSHVTGPVA